MNVYFDLDGVLMLYERDAYISENGRLPIYLLPGHHYFRDRQPDKWVLHLLEILMAHQRATDSKDKTFILSSIKVGNMFNEHFHDKLLRTMELIPQMPIENILFSVSEKHDCVPFITGKKLSTQDVLIDDFNPNLNAWTEAGGTAFKYCNGINNPSSYDGPLIGPMFSDTYDAMRRLLAVKSNDNI